MVIPDFGSRVPPRDQRGLDPTSSENTSAARKTKKVKIERGEREGERERE